MSRILRWIAIVVAVPFVLGLALVAWQLFAARRALTRERIGIDFRVLVWARIWTAVYRVPFPLYLAILKNEGASQAKGGDYPKGDVSHRWGPAVGPGQVLRVNVDRLWAAAPAPLRWFVTASSVDELAEPANTRQAVWASVKVLREALDASGGEWRGAARRYNGSGAPAEAYADRAMQTVDRLSA